MASIDLFISYSGSDIEFTEVLAAELESRGIIRWYAKRDIPIGAAYPVEISQALDRCKGLLLIFSSATNRAANENLHILREIEYAAAQRKPILPVRIADVEPHAGLAYFLRTLQWIEKSAWDNRLVDHIASVYRGRPLVDRPSTAGAFAPAQEIATRSAFPLAPVVAASLLTALVAIGIVERDRITSFLGRTGAATENTGAPPPLPAPSVGADTGPKDSTELPVPARPAQPAISTAEALRLARTAIARQDYRSAVDSLSAPSEAGNSAAQFNLAGLVENGQGIGRDPARAADLYRNAAEHGHACAMNRLGELYDEGAMGYRDRQEAARWWRMGAEAGCPWAKYHLGLAYKDGTGVVRSGRDAVLWLGRAADDGVIDAMSHLAAILHKGDLVPADAYECVRRLRQAAVLGHENAQYRLAMALESGQGAERSLAEAHVWASVSAVKGEPEPTRFRNALGKRLPPGLVSDLDETARRRTDEVRAAERSNFARLEDSLWQLGR